MQPRVLDLLCGAATKRIKGSDAPEIKRPVTKHVRALHGRLRQHKHAVKRIEAALKRRGFVTTYGGKLDTDHSEQVKLLKQFDARKEDRQRKVRDLRDQALIDLLDATPAEAKRYLVRLKKKLEGI